MENPALNLFLKCNDSRLLILFASFNSIHLVNSGSQWFTNTCITLGQGNKDWGWIPPVKPFYWEFRGRVSRGEACCWILCYGDPLEIYVSSRKDALVPALLLFTPLPPTGLDLAQGPMWVYQPCSNCIFTTAEESLVSASFCPQKLPEHKNRDVWELLTQDFSLENINSARKAS